MKKQELIQKANQGHCPMWDLVHLLEDDGKVRKIPITRERKAAAYISETQVLINLSDTEILIITEEFPFGPIADYRLLVYKLKSNTVDGAYRHSNF